LLFTRNELPDDETAARKQITMWKPGSKSSKISAIMYEKKFFFMFLTFTQC
jgi:hypothetical protein